MKNYKKIVALLMITMIVLLTGSISVFADQIIDTTGAGYQLIASISGSVAYATADTSYYAPADRALCAVELFELYQDGSYTYLSGYTDTNYASTSSSSSGATNIINLIADHHYGLDGYYIGVISTQL